MTVQRTYNLPNCTLLIEGISPGDSNVLSVLTNFECRFQHTQSSISGGRKLLDALVEAVGQYAQDLSGGNAVAIAVAPVRLEPINAHAHQLHIDPSEDANTELTQPLTIRLNTIQLFDLMDSIDRLCLDRKTLPDLELVTNTSEVVIQSKTKERVIPAVMGIASFAIAASAMFLIPVPKPQPEFQPQSEVPTQLTPKTRTQSPVIKDFKLIRQLKSDLTKQIDQNWKASPSFTEPVSYRVVLNAEGEIVAYKRTNPLSPEPEEKLEKELPLRKLAKVKTVQKTVVSQAAPEPTVTFWVTFKPNTSFTVTQNNPKIK